MPPIILIFGITGQQGGSVVNYILDSPLREHFKIRGASRDITSPQAQSLTARGIELCHVDWSDANSLAVDLQNVHTVFLMTLPAGLDGKDLREAICGKMCIDAAIEAGVQNVLFSTLPDAIKISGGRYRGIHNFNAKAEVEQYIRGKPLRSAFVSPGRFMQNYVGKLAPKLVDGTYTISDRFTPEEKVPLIDITEIGMLVTAILTNFEKYEGKVLAAAERLYPMKEIAAALSESKEVRYEQLSEAAMRKSMPPQIANVFVEAQKFQKEYGFYGPDSAALIEQTKVLTGVKLTSLAEYLKVNQWWKE